MTAMRVVVARMTPSKVKKLRNLLERRESTASLAASQNEALAAAEWLRINSDDVATALGEGGSR
jgi:hypothetical protein